jgi:serine/threonine protein kinase
MPRLQMMFECLGAALCENGAPALSRLAPFESYLLNFARATHRHIVAIMPPAELRAALRELISAPEETVELAVYDAVASIQPPVPEELRETLVEYLQLLPEVVRQRLRRPGDPAGISIPEEFSIRRAEDWLPCLPNRLPNYHTDEQPKDLDGWQLASLRGLGPYGEVWDAYDEEQSDISPAALKFITDPELVKAFREHRELLVQALDLDVIPGLIPLRSVYFDADPPCLEYVHLPGYDLANVMVDARTRNDRPRPEQAANVVRRIAKVVGRLHRQSTPIVHRGLKPSNVILNPTSEGKVTIWVSDLAWGQISATRLNAAREPAQSIRLAMRGSFAPIYAAPQVLAGELPHPTDDVYSIGMIWYQLLVRDPSARAPKDPEWASEIRRHGFTDSQAGLLSSCLSATASDRPKDGHHLADLISANVAPIRNGDSGSVRLKGTSSFEQVPRKDKPSKSRLKTKPPG